MSLFLLALAPVRQYLVLMLVGFPCVAPAAGITLHLYITDSFIIVLCDIVVPISRLRYIYNSGLEVLCNKR